MGKGFGLLNLFDSAKVDSQKQYGCEGCPGEVLGLYWLEKAGADEQGGGAISDQIFLDRRIALSVLLAIIQEMIGQERFQGFGVSRKAIFRESTLSSIPDDVLQLKKQLELQSGSKLVFWKPTPFEIMLTCHNFEKYQCGFKYLFRSTTEDPEKTEYILHTEFDSHHLECLSESPRTIRAKSDKIASPSFKRYKPDSEFTIKPQILEPFSLTPKSLPSDQSESLDKSLAQECLLLQSKHSSKLYTEDEFGALKKQLQFQSKGLISKSTEFHPELGYTTKISFKCKYENSTCPYLTTLTYMHERNQKNQKLYRLDKIQSQHSSSCILDDEEVHFNFVTRKIDENFNVLMKILRENSSDVKPKRVLELFTSELGEEPDFIYKGIQNKNNKRAAKKYFDNSVAKARNTIKEKV